MIVFESVKKSYTNELFLPANTALKNISFSVSPGRTLGLIGANGAGKSTSIRLLMDFIRPDSGLVRVFDKPPNHSYLRKKIGYLPEVASFPANLTILDLLRFTGSTCGISRFDLKNRSEKWLTTLDLWEARRRPLRSYSKGMQQRANFVLALINEPDLYVLDEPMSGLDPMGRSKIISLIQELKQAGKTILFCSHILEDVDKLVDDILLLHKGEKLFYGTPSELAAQENKISIADAFVSMVQRKDNNG